jgi:A/G-specific adenine glycosylase
LGNIASDLLHWYAANARLLPWRGHPDPYAVWVSEIMLQQTRVETVIPYFQHWMERFPTIPALAGASLQDVLATWEGLGYYSRARNLHNAAQVLIIDYGGRLPRDMKALRSLPGIGRYTAGAIASIAFGMDEPTLDSNIRRVLARLFNVEIPARSREGEARLWKLAAENLPPGQASDFNQALMDLGATICTPRQPDCDHCPLMLDCAAYTLGVQEERPILPARAVSPHYVVTAAVIQRDGKALIAQRPAQGLLGGLWEFPGGKLIAGEDLATCLTREIREELDAEIEVGGQIGVFRHAYTHFRVTLHAFDCTLLAGEPHNLEHSALAWASISELRNYPMGKLDRMIANQLSIGQ